MSTLTHLPFIEQTVIARIAKNVGIDVNFLAAVRIAENGGPGREFGVLSEKATTYEEQCQITAISIRNNLIRFMNQTPYSLEFIQFMQERWAPKLVANDPNNLNKNWINNVSKAYTK